jgi:hypothetical protein
VCVCVRAYVYVLKVRADRLDGTSGRRSSSRELAWEARVK